MQFLILKKYPLSIVVFFVVIFLSFFNPQKAEVSITIPYADKVAHFLIYFWFSIIWCFEFVRSHKGEPSKLKGLFYVFIFIVSVSGCIELLQEYLVDYRGGDWFDLLANTLGALLGYFISYNLSIYFIYSRREKK